MGFLEQGVSDSPVLSGILGTRCIRQPSVKWDSWNKGVSGSPVLSGILGIMCKVSPVLGEILGTRCISQPSVQWDSWNNMYHLAKHEESVLE